MTWASAAFVDARWPGCHSDALENAPSIFTVPIVDILQDIFTSLVDGI